VRWNITSQLPIQLHMTVLTFWDVTVVNVLEVYERAAESSWLFVVCGGRDTYCESGSKTKYFEVQITTNVPTRRAAVAVFSPSSEASRLQS